MTVQSLNRSCDQAAWRTTAIVLSFGAFVVGTDAFVVAGLLPDLAASLHVSVGAAGQLVTVFAIAYALAAVPLGVLASRWSPRNALLLALLMLACGNALSASAPSYGLVLAARIVAAAGAALYTATATATAGSVAGAERRGRAIAIVLFGATASLVLGAPLGTQLGSALGWRATLWAVAGLAVPVAIAIRVRVATNLARPPRVGLTGLRALMADRGVLSLLARSFLAIVGVYLPYTYISVVYEPVIAHGIPLSGLLAVFGVAACVGVLVAGSLVDRLGPKAVIVTALLLLTGAFALVPAARLSPATGVAILAVTGWLSFSVNAPQQHLLVSLAPDAGRQATAVYQAVIYAAVSASGAVGALVLDHVRGIGVVVVAAMFTLFAAALSATASPRPAAQRATEPQHEAHAPASTSWGRDRDA